MKTCRLSPKILILVFFISFLPASSNAQQDQIREANSLNEQVIKLYQQGRYSDAIRLAEKARNIREKVLGPDHPDVATSLNNLATLYKAMGEYARAERLHRQSLAIREKALGPDHPEVAQGLNNLAEFYKTMGDYAKAEPLLKRSLAIWEKTLGPDHPNVATSLNNLAGLYYSVGDYARAEPLYKRSLTIREKALGPDHPEVAGSLNNLALLYDVMGDYAKTEPLLKRSLAIREKTLGPDHPNVAASLNSLATLYRAMGDYARAEPMYKRSLAIVKKALGPDHPNVATSLNNLAGLYYSVGDYARAEPLYKRSLIIREKALGPDHPEAAESLSNLALLYHVMGDYARAEPLYKRSLAIREKALGPDHPEVAMSLNNLALLCYAIGEYTRAEPLYKRSLAIREKALGPDHPDVAMSLSNLALLYHVMGDYARAEPLYRRSLVIQEKALGPDHPDVARYLNNLAGLYKTMGDYAKAEPLHKRSLTIAEKGLGPDHPEVARYLNNLALLYAAKEEFSKAYSLVIRAQKIDEKLIDQIIGFASEDRQTLFLSSRMSDLEAALCLAAMHLREDPLVRKDALDIWLRRKGIVLEAQRRFQEALVYSDDPRAVSTFQRLAKIRSQLSQVTFGGPGKEGSEAYQRKIADLEIKKRDLEEKLNSLSQAYALKKKIERADSRKVAQTLPVKTVLLEFVRINTFNFKAKRKETRWLPPRYLAFVLHSGKGDTVEMVDLGDAGEIDKAIALFKKELGESKGREALKSMETSRRIHDLVFEPLLKALEEVKEVFISPDGNLNLIPFEVLQDQNGRFLIEKYTFNYLAAGRDILGFGETNGKTGRDLLLGDPDFDLGADEKASTLRKLGLAEGKSGGPIKRSRDMEVFSFQRLPGTREEVEALKRLLGDEEVDLYTGREALEEVLKKKKTPRLLHLATHGFFLSDQDYSAHREEGVGRGVQLAGTQTPMVKGIKVENPLLRAGIALAGANNTLRSGDGEKSDGIVTAEKVLGLKLRGTDMVVLSACETGLGEVMAGEGVYGLRRAFIQAGTKSLVMSMWSVPDRETRELMVAFYKNMLSGKMSRCQALRQAALKQMQVVKKRYGNKNPFYWGAFVFLGEP